MQEEEDRLAAEKLSKELEISTTETETISDEPPSPERENPSKKAEALLRPTGIQEPFEGSVIRKHDWESTARKATNRSWEKVYLYVKAHTLYTYKDQKHRKQDPDNYYHGEQPLDLRRSSVEVATDYTKRRHVFRLKLIGGAEYLFQAKDDVSLLNINY
ncbi:spectrin beta chain-like [Stegodyphus dumicola]|uniref:spectrin beta chain-like n=1 Tax=Stegodyphus dumicola TaxID=202533 RepID=UPI0015B06D26|nr:spectrin beta chain-like [Stegodyphus dumicola]